MALGCTRPTMKCTLVPTSQYRVGKKGKMQYLYFNVGYYLYFELLMYSISKISCSLKKVNDVSLTKKWC